MSGNLIIYFSRKGQNYFSGDIRSIDKGNTEYVAEFIRDAIGGDLFEVVREKPYPDNYKQCCNEAYSELKAEARPELSKYLDTADGYDRIFVCGPCWCGTYPIPVFAQLDRLDLKGKKVFPVMTHEGSGFGNSVKDLKRLYPDTVFGEGLTVTGSSAATSCSVVSDWAKRAIQN